jgi:hypothetical protein
MSIKALLGTLPTNNNALRFWVLQGYNATHIRALVTNGTSVANIATEFKQLLYALLNISNTDWTFYIAKYYFHD